MKVIVHAVLILALSVVLSSCASLSLSRDNRAAETFKHIVKNIDLTDSLWDGHAISYSGYREGQSPDDDIHPKKPEILEDLRILERNWNLIRVYGSDINAQRVLEVIDENALDLKVQLGVWLAKESGTDENLLVNAEQVQQGIAFANRYKDIVVGINVGNEILVSWAFWPVPLDKVISYVQQIQAAVEQPVTVADNWEVWESPAGTRLAEVVDYVFVHCYAMWDPQAGTQGITTAVDYLDQRVQNVRANIPADKQIVVGETGWATFAPDNMIYGRIGDQGNEENEKRYFDALMAWSIKNSITTFYFSAFDEPWKGTAAEGHWGLFSEDRKAKKAMDTYYPELVSTEETSPGYEDWEFPAGAFTDIAPAFQDKIAKSMGIRGAMTPMNSGSVALSTTSLDGDRSIQFTHDGKDWGGFHVTLANPVDIRAFKAVVLSLQISDEVAYLELKLNDGSEPGINLMLCTPEIKGGWKTFVVPLADYPTKLNLSAYGNLGFWHPKNEENAYVAGDILIDNIHFR
jgi:exo-beta-1,3-glucanase (GH17 family)